VKECFSCEPSLVLLSPTGAIRSILQCSESQALASCAPSSGWALILPISSTLQQGFGSDREKKSRLLLSFRQFLSCRPGWNLDFSSTQIVLILAKQDIDLCYLLRALQSTATEFTESFERMNITEGAICDS